MLTSVRSHFLAGVYSTKESSHCHPAPAICQAAWAVTPARVPVRAAGESRANRLVSRRIIGIASLLPPSLRGYPVCPVHFRFATIMIKNKVSRLVFLCGSGDLLSMF